MSKTISDLIVEAHNTGKDNLVIAAGEDAAAARAAIGAAASGGTETVAWDDVTDKPAVIAAGATAEEARNAIGAAATGGGGGPTGPIVILASGQSNMGNVFTDVVGNDPYETNLNYWNWFNGGPTGTAFTTVPTASVGLAMQFGNEIAKQNPSREVYVINISFGGQSITCWSDNTPIDARTQIIANVNAASALIPGFTGIDYFIWWQGEADAASYSTYKTEFDKFWNAIKTETWFDEDKLKTIIYGITGSPRVDIFPNNDLLNHVLEGIVDQNAGSAIYVPSGFYTDEVNWAAVNDVHMSAVGYKAIARKSATASQGFSKSTSSFHHDNYNFNLLEVTSNGIMFPGISVGQTIPIPASGLSTLNCYQEAFPSNGVISGLTSAGTGTYPENVAWFVRVGSLVNFIIAIEWTGHTGTGQIQYGDMPFSNPLFFPQSFEVWTEGLGNTSIATAEWQSFDNKFHFFYFDNTGAKVPLQMTAAGKIAFYGSTIRSHF